MPNKITHAWLMNSQFSLGRKDMIFLVIVAVVILVLSLGSHERRTMPTPNDATHAQVTSRAQCLQCHDSGGIRPQPLGHTKANQCFQCHTQPKAWSSKL